MTAVGLVDSAKYGFKFLTYLVVVTLVGGGALGLGAALAWPEVQALRGAGQAATTALAGGGVLAFLGAVVLLTGYFGSAYKLVADAVAAGTAGAAIAGESVAEAEQASTDESDGSSDDDAGEEATEDTSRPVPGPEPTDTPVEGGVETQAESPASPSGTGESPEAISLAGDADGDVESDDTGFQPLEQEENPPEPTAEEIAFGTTPGGDETAEEAPVTADEPESDETEPEPEPEESESSGSVKPAARDAPSDPLGDRGD